jgi:signal transduction histidine kinase
MMTTMATEVSPDSTARQGSQPLAALQAAIRHAPIVLLAIDQSGAFLLVEGGSLPSWQTTCRPQLGQSMYDLLEDSPELIEGLEKALAGQSQKCRTYIGACVFELRFSPVAPESNTAVRACCMAQDITEQAESDRQRIEQQLTLFEQERRMAADFRALIEGLPLGIVVTRADRILFFNLAARTCLRWLEPSLYLGREFSQFVPPTSRTRFFDQPNGATELTDFGELQVTTGDGKSIIAELQSVGIEFDGLPARLLSVRDVTDVHRMEQDLRQAQRLEAIGRLAAGIAHEINTPIQFIGDNAQFLAGVVADMSTYLAFCEQLLRGTSFTEQQNALGERKEQLDISFAQNEAPKATQNILEGVARVAKIVSAMKGFAHPGSAEKNLSDINRALETTIVVATNEWKDVARVVTEFGELPLVPCHLGELNQVFLNLLVNAAHAIGSSAKRHGNTGLVTVRTYLENGMAVVAVSDNGGGIPPEIGDRVFDPFFTTKEVGSGTGQGLALARRVVVEQHHGQIDFVSDLGIGTTFFVRLPLRPPEDSAPMQP